MVSGPDPKRHPHAFTLSLLRLALTKLPPTFDEKVREKFEHELERFERHPETPYEDIRDVIVRFGKRSWSARKAYEELYARYGRSSEEAFLLENLDEGIRQKYETFIHEGGKINHIERAVSADDLMNPSPFERYFSPDEKFVVEQALLVARDDAHREIDQLVTGEKREEYDRLIGEYEKKEKKIDEMLGELRSFAGVSDRWSPVIEDRVRTIEEGWSIVGPAIDDVSLEKELEYWRGTLESFLHA